MGLCSSALADLDGDQGFVARMVDRYSEIRREAADANCTYLYIEETKSILCIELVLICERLGVPSTDYPMARICRLAIRDATDTALLFIFRNPGVNGPSSPGRTACLIPAYDVMLAGVFREQYRAAIASAALSPTAVQHHEEQDEIEHNWPETAPDLLVTDPDLLLDNISVISEEEVTMSSFVAMTEAVAEMQERNLRQPCPVANQAEPVEALVDQPLPYPNTRLNSPHAAPGCQDYPELMPMVPERDTVDPALWELSTVPTLLLKEPDMVTKFTSVPLHGSAGSITPATPETRRLRILIAEDSRTSAKWLRRCIRHLMFSRGLGSAEFVQCDNGLLAFKELLTRYQSACDQRPDLVIMDLSMPGYNADKIMNALSEYRDEMTLIFISGSVEKRPPPTKIINPEESLGGMCFMPKPPHLPSMERAIRGSLVVRAAKNRPDGVVSAAKLAKKLLGPQLYASIRAENTSMSDLHFLRCTVCGAVHGVPQTEKVAEAISQTLGYYWSPVKPARKLAK